MYLDRAEKIQEMLGKKKPEKGKKDKAHSSDHDRSAADSSEKK